MYFFLFKLISLCYKAYCGATLWYTIKHPAVEFTWLYNGQGTTSETEDEEIGFAPYRQSILFVKGGRNG